MINATTSNNSKNSNINWLQLTQVDNDLELSNQYANICQQHKEQNKWVLFINPEESSIEQLAKTHEVDPSKILMVNYRSSLKNNAKIELTHITSVLSKGNCSAVIVSNSSFTNQEIMQLESSAKQGSTQCFILKNTASNPLTSFKLPTLH